MLKKHKMQAKVKLETFFYILEAERDERLIKMSE